jgi:hypothetical protein
MFSGILTRYECQKGELCYSVSQFTEIIKLPSSQEISVENKGFSTALILRRESTIGFGHASAAREPNPNEERKFVTHVEADESAFDPWTAIRAGTSNYVYPERPCYDGE